MKKLLILFLLSSLFTACNVQEEAEIKQEEGNRVLVSERKDVYGNPEKSDRLTKVGYSSKQKNEVSTGQVGSINREKLAEMITDLTVKLPDVTNAATLVTDDEVFIVYRADTTNEALVADQVYKTALSIVPRYYKAYVSTDQKLISQIQGLQSGTMNDKEYRQSLDMLKREIKNNPYYEGKKDNM